MNEEKVTLVAYMPMPEYYYDRSDARQVKYNPVEIRVYGKNGIRDTILIPRSEFDAKFPKMSIREIVSESATINQ